MHRVLAAIIAAIPAVAVLATATPAQAKPVQVVHDGACRYLYVNDENVTFNGICYLGPPPPN